MMNARPVGEERPICRCRRFKKKEKGAPMERRMIVACALAGAVQASAASLTTTVTGRYLAVPVENGKPDARLEIFDGGRRAFHYDVRWAKGKPDWTASLDLGALKGRSATFVFSGENPPAPARGDLRFSDERFPAPADQFDEPWRPQLHFTPPLGWNNDPNGLSYRNGEWHLFYQHNPVGAVWGNMSWGHAVSRDLVHWADAGVAIAPDETGAMFSGSAVTDAAGTAGFGKNAHILLYTAASGRPTQRLAWSHDARTYTKWQTPAIPARADALRDPKVLWYAPGRHWVMLVYGIVEPNRHGMTVFTSKNLKDWEFASRIPGDPVDVGRYLFECPDLFELPVPGENRTRWVLTAGNRLYAIGTFDGRRFRPEAEQLDQMRIHHHLTGVYAWQTFSDAPRGRCVQIAWARFETLNRGKKGAMFSQGMTLPAELSLTRTAQGLRLAKKPVEELKALRCGEATSFDAFDGELAEIEFSCRPGGDAYVVFDLRGLRISYSVPRRTLTLNNLSTAWDLDAHGRLALRIFLDRVGLEIFSQDGLQYLPLPDAVPDPAKRRISYVAGDAKRAVRDVTCRVWKLRGIYEKIRRARR